MPRSFMMRYHQLLLPFLIAASSLAAPSISAREATECPDVAVYFAKGTLEPTSLGIIVGPEFNTALSLALNNLSPKRSLEFVGIDYPALLSVYLEGGDKGAAKTMADFANAKAEACAETKIFIAGYSQGAQIVHLAAAQLNPATVPRISGAITFGDPFRHQPYPSPIVSKIFCIPLDVVCDNIFPPTPQHFLYGINAGDAAEFVVSRL